MTRHAVPTDQSDGKRYSRIEEELISSAGPSRAGKARLNARVGRTQGQAEVQQTQPQDCYSVAETAS